MGSCTHPSLFLQLSPTRSSPSLCSGEKRGRRASERADERHPPKHRPRVARARAHRATLPTLVASTVHSSSELLSARRARARRPQDGGRRSNGGRGLGWARPPAHSSRWLSARGARARARRSKGGRLSWRPRRQSGGMSRRRITAACHGGNHGRGVPRQPANGVRIWRAELCAGMALRRHGWHGRKATEGGLGPGSVLPNPQGPHPSLRDRGGLRLIKRVDSKNLFCIFISYFYLIFLSCHFIVPPASFASGSRRASASRGRREARRRGVAVTRVTGRHGGLRLRGRRHRRDARATAKQAPP